MFNTILRALDGSHHSHKATDVAIDLARIYDAKLVLMHVLLINADSEELSRFARIEGLAPSVEPMVQHLRAVEGRLEYGYTDPPQGTRILADIGQMLLDDAKQSARKKGVRNVETILADGDAATAILRGIEERAADCVVMGSRGLSDMAALVLDSVSHEVMNSAACT